MILAKGSRVRFKYTGEEGIVEALLEGQMINVRMDDGEIIPAFIEDIERIDENTRRPSHKPPVKAKIVPGKKDRIPTPPKRSHPDSQYALLKEEGVQLAFEEIQSPDGITSHFLIHLINATRSDILYSFVFGIAGQHTPYPVNGKLERMHSIELGTMPFDQLNEAPVLQLECWQISTEGTGPQLSKKIKIKPQQFFKKNRTAPLLDIPSYLYLVFDSFTPTQRQKKEKEDLRSYTQRKAKETPKSNDLSDYISKELHNVKTFADFNNEIDLHIENLVDNTRGMSNADILHLQMRRFEDYMQQAIRIGVPKVFIIHGVGKGRLRSEIARWLDDNPYVVSHKNEYHHRFGYGATEVDL